MTDRDDHLQLFLAISIVLHALLFLFYISPVLSNLKLPSISAPIELVEIPLVRTRPSPARVRLPAAAPVPPPPEVPKEMAKAEPVPPPDAPPPPEQPPGDVVEIPKPAVEQTPRDTRFRALYNQRVARPARARDLPIDTRGLPTSRKSADDLAKPTLRESEDRAAEAREAQEAQRAQAREEAGGRPGAGGSESLDAAAPGAAGERGSEVPQPLVEDGVFQRRAKAGAGAAAGGGRPGLPGVGGGLRNLLPTEERLAQLERGAAGGRNNPYNPDLVPTDATMSMDTLRDENAGYWIAVKRRIALNWDPIRLIRAAKNQYDQTAANFGSMSAISQSAQGAIGEAASRTGAGVTKVRFRIAKDGSRDGDPQITKRSGSEFLDEEALRAVQLGYPFPPVPDRVARNSLTLEFTFIVGER